MFRGKEEKKNDKIRKTNGHIYMAKLGDGCQRVLCHSSVKFSVNFKVLQNKTVKRKTN